MPLPAILAALARVGAGLAARAGATGVARSLVGMARTAGSGVARRAAARAAAQAATSRGASAGVTAAAEGIHIQPGNVLGLGTPSGGGFRVLENTKLTNARSIFQAIYGQTPPAGATSAAAASAPAAQVGAAASTAEQAAATAAAAPPAAAPPLPPGAPPAGAPPPAAPGATPPSNPRPQSLLDRSLDAWQRARAAYDSARQRFTPIADQVANLSIDQRYNRLQTSGRLPSIGDVARQFGTPNPTREQTVQHGEAEEERQRQEEISKSRQSQVGQAAWGAGKRSLAGVLMSATPVAAATAPVWLIPIINGFERLGRTVSDTNRDLSRFNERIADSFARLDYAQLRSRQQMASATSGSASFLNDQLAQLVRELQPMRETLQTFMNSAGGAIVSIARIGALIVKWHPLFVAMRKTAETAERFMGKREGEVAQRATKDFLASIRDGKFKMPKNPGPGER